MTMEGYSHSHAANTMQNTCHLKELPPETAYLQNSAIDSSTGTLSTELPIIVLSQCAAVTNSL